MTRGQSISAFLGVDHLHQPLSRRPAPTLADWTSLTYLASTPRGQAGCGHPGGAADLQHGFVDLQVKSATGHIEHDLVAVLDERNRAALGGFRSDVTDA